MKRPRKGQKIFKITAPNRGNQKRRCFMMYSEFYERTKTEIPYEEYHYVEESYCEFDGNKDEFCKQWLADVKLGKWALEFRLRKALDDQKAEYERQLAEKESTIEFYRPYFDEARGLKKKLDGVKRRLEMEIADL